MKENKEYQDITAFAEKMGMTVEEYLIYLHRKNQSIKTVLLNDSHGFKAFLNGFHTILDDLATYAQIEDSKIATNPESLQAASDLLYKVSSDPMLLAQMYEHYLYNTDEDPKKLINY